VGGVSKPPYASFNLGARCGDESDAIAANRQRFRQLLPSEPGWVRQVHGAVVVARESVAGNVEADGLVCATPGLACTILTADCLPVLLCDHEARHVAAAHAGWRGLVAGVLEASVAAMAVEAHRLMAWIGPGISVQAYEVGPELRTEVLRKYPGAGDAFETRGGRLFADLAGIAGLALRHAGVGSITTGDFCTYTDETRFYSYRRDGRTGRMATTIWFE